MALGESVKEDTQVLLISDLSRVWVELAVTASDIDTVRVGQSVTITSSAGSATASGKISHVGNLLGETSRSARARVVIDNPDQAWRPGLFVNVALVRGSKTAAVSVAADAVQNLDGRSVVFIPVAGGFKAQRVTVGARDAQRVEVLDGIALDARYVATGSFIVKAQQGKSDAGHGH
jgi:cobalt-zinc-cadmium efflux system membrane fusion protein